MNYLEWIGKRTVASQQLSFQPYSANDTRLRHICAAVFYVYSYSPSTKKEYEGTIVRSYLKRQNHLPNAPVQATSW